MGGAGREHVVGVKVQKDHDQKGGLPGEASGGDHLNHRLGEPGDETELVQVRSHGDEGGKPGESIPGGAFSEALLPSDDTSDEKGGEADERGSNSPNSDFGPKDPKAYGDNEGGRHDLLVTAHGAELLELLLRLDGGLGGVLDLGGIQHIQNQGHRNEADHTRKGRGERPRPPRDGLANGGSGEVHGQGVGGHGSDEHAGGDARGLEDSHHHVGTHLLLGALLRVRAARHAERLCEGEEDATGARGEGGNGGGQERLGKDERIAEAEGGLAKDGNDGVGDAVTEAGLDETPSEEEGESDEPRNLRGEGAESSSEGEDAETH
mmetsp:Transcript_13441/g.21946  ORF Transcript_13441/g.21946 Transcript_13441/m.21946 type:complete len:321 (-) Transcript_13441:599-1561(-)